MGIAFYKNHFLKNQIEVIHQDLFWLLTKAIYIWEYTVHMYLYAYVYVLKKQASGFNHMQNVITLFFLGYVCGQEMDLAKKWAIYSSFKSTKGK